MAVCTLKPVVSLPHVFAQFAGALQPFRALVALVRADISMRLHMLCEVVLTFERPRAHQTAVWPVTAVTDQMSTEIVGKQEVPATSVARVRELHAIVICLHVLDHVFA